MRNANSVSAALLVLVALVSACANGLRDRHPHAPRDIETYISRLESPERVSALQVDRVIQTLKLDPSDVVADIGSGPGVFSVPLGRVLESGLVYAVDVEPKQLDALRGRATQASLANVVPVLGGFDDPFLPVGRIDLALVVDTYHHIQGRTEYFARLRGAFREDGRLAIVEWKAGELPMGPPPAHKLAEGVRPSELRAAGFQLVETFDFLELHDFEIWRPAANPGPAVNLGPAADRE